MITLADGSTRRLDWVKLQNKLPRVSGYIFAVALGGWINSVVTQEASLPYKDKATHQFEQVQKVAGKNPVATVTLLKKKVGCEHWRAEVTENVAKQAIVSANSDSVPTPDTKAIPADNCLDQAAK